MEEDGRYSTTVSLEPFIHQVGGHSFIQQFDQYTVCKPLFSKELRFYQDVSPLFKPFIPEFKGEIATFSTCEYAFELEKQKYSFMAINDIQGVVSVMKSVEENGDSRWKMVTAGDNIKLHSYRYGKHCSSCSCQQNDKNEKNQGWKDALYEIQTATEGDCVDVSTLNNQNSCNLDDSSLEYILLENVVGHYKRPCILDLKMGTEKHKDYVVSKEEADRRQARWDQTTSKSLGVRVCGMKVYIVTEENFLVKSHGRDLTVEGFKDAMKSFFFNGKESRYDVIEPYLTQLGELLNIMEHQSSYRFYNTSLLLIYEGEVSEIDDPRINRTDNREAVDPRKSSRTNVGVRMIDFAHVQYISQTMNSELQQVLDEGYLFGLRSVIRILEETLEELRSNNS